jgi:hypothetical protein
MQTKKLDRWRLTHLPSLLTRRQWYRWISGKVDPCIWIILDHWDLSRQPREEVIIEGLGGPPTTLSRQQRCPSAHCRESRQMSSYCQPRTEAWNSLKKERTQDGPKPEIPVCPLSASCQLPCHACQ